MVVLTDEIWNALVTTCRPPPKFAEGGRLPPNAREEVENALREYAAGDQQGRFRLIEPETRKALKRTRRETDKLSTQLKDLKARQDFDRIANAFVDHTIDSYLVALDGLANSLERAAKSLHFRSQNKRWSKTSLGILFVELLKIRSCHLRIDAPSQVKETSSSGTFHEYLRICLKLVERQVDGAALDEMLKKGIGSAVELFQIYKNDPIYSWEWQDMFPQSEANLNKSRKFLRG
ncbi:hypothetical protein [Bradyrhizobium septentrionale]|uniref:HEPN AbiU2-like domain-containing protein n=1 Tax=Bradyrhizobium septentrionale TaxID=1404411 RepID=A0ABZ2P1C3_9BRAD